MAAQENSQSKLPGEAEPHGIERVRRAADGAVPWGGQPAIAKAILNAEIMVALRAYLIGYKNFPFIGFDRPTLSIEILRTSMKKHIQD